MTEIRPEIVAGCLRRDPEAIAAATWLEQREVVRLAALHSYETAAKTLRDLGTPVTPRTPELTEWNLHQLRRLVAQGAALAAVADRLGPWWNPHPDVRLVDLLKIQPTTVVVDVARQLAIVGLHDLDDLLPPDLSDFGA